MRPPVLRCSPFVAPLFTALLALGLALAGCSAWHAPRLAAPAPPPASETESTRAAIPSHELGTVRIVRADGSTMDLRHARIEGDSLVGETRRDALLGRGPHRVAVARADVRQVDQLGFSTGRTLGLLLLIVAVGGVAARAVIGGIVGSEAD